MDRQRLGPRSVCFQSSQMYLSKGVGRQLGSPGSLRVGGAYRAAGRWDVKRPEVHQGGFIRPPWQAPLIGPH